MPPAPDMPRVRNQSLDLMRFLAAFGIVYCHMHAPFPQVGYLALALFVTLTTLLAVFAAESRSFGRFMRGRFWRILVPWFIACAVYGLVVVVQQRSVSVAWGLMGWENLLIGTYWHLWFLPFTVITAPLAWFTSRRLTSRRAIAKAVMPMAILGAGAMAFHDNGALEAPWIQWACAVIPLFYGLLAGAAKRHGTPLAPVAYILVATLVPIVFWSSLPAGFMLGGALLFEIFWRMELHARFLPVLGRLAFGIYLVHPLVMWIWGYVTRGMVPPALGAVAVFLLSMVAAAGLEAAWAILMPRRAPQAAAPA